jgi:oxygen-dependent protoporphyrinogen oxidase
MRVGIIGAGITGLALTHYLAERGVDSVAFEAGSEPGGVISSQRVDGHLLEVGPQRMRKTPGIAELAKVGGVADDIVEARAEDLYVYADGTLGAAPLSARALVETNLLSVRGKLRLLAEPLTRPGHPAESVADVFVRKFGRETYERFAGPLYGGLYGSDPAEMPAAFALEGLLERERESGSLLRAFHERLGGGDGPPPIAFAEGNQQLPAALADRYSDRVEFDTPVTAVERANEQRSAATADAATPRKASDGGTAEFRVHTSSETHHVDTVVATTPADVTADLLADVAPDVERLSQLRYNPLAMVFLESHHGREGKGYQVAFDADLHTLGVSWNGSMFGRDGVNTAFLGGMHEPELVEKSDDRLGEIARAEFERAVGAPASVIDVTRLDPGFPAWDNSWWTLEDLDLPPGIELATNYTGRMGIPSRVREARELAAELADGSSGYAVTD